jgi:predicted MFS family arabinose efflux permease
VGVLGNPIFSLTVVFAETVFDTGPVGLGLLTAALGAGAVCYALAGAVVRSRRSLGLRAATAMIALGLALCLIGVVPTLTLGIVAAMAVGAAFLAAFATLNTTIQLLAPDQLRGRVLAARHMVFSASIAVGVLLCGVLTDAWGVQWATISFGAALVAVALLVALLPGWRFSLLDQASAAPDTPIPESDSPL